MLSLETAYSAVSSGIIIRSMRRKFGFTRNRHGYSVLERLFLIAVAGIVLFTVWYAWQWEQAKHPLRIPSQSNAAGDSPRLIPAFMDPIMGKRVEFLYPDTWQLAEGQPQTSPHYESDIHPYFTVGQAHGCI